MNTIKTPVVIVIEGGNDLDIFASIEEAQSDLEAIDLRNDEYVVYDAEGRLLVLDVVSERIPLLFGIFKTTVERVRIQPGEEDPVHAEELRSALIRYLETVCLASNSFQSDDTAKLIDRAMEVVESNRHPKRIWKRWKQKKGVCP